MTGRKRCKNIHFYFSRFAFALLPFLSGCGVGLDTVFISSNLSYPNVLWPKTVEDGVNGGSVYGNQGVVVDFSGNIYVVSMTTKGMDGQPQIGTQDYFITKYAPGGIRQWTLEDGASGATLECVRQIAVDSAGNIYTTGITNKAIDGQALYGTYDFFITKYNSNGTRQWTIEDGASGATTTSYSLALDASANVYVTGTTNKALDGQSLHGVVDFFITKYDRNGNHQWTVEDGASTATVNGGQSVTVDAAGNIDILGNLKTGPGIDGQTYYGNYDYFVTQYNSSGVRQWTVEDGSNGVIQQTGKDIAVDPSGNIYISGFTSTALDGQTRVCTPACSDFFISKYNSSGTRQWTVEDGSSTAYDYGLAVAVDTSANIYLTGYTQRGLDGSSLIGVQDFFITQYNSTGNRQWTVEDGTSGATLSGTGIALDIYNNVYVAGSAAGAGVDNNGLIGSQDLFVTQYSLSGVRE
jgi:hypothetical protein